MKVSSNVQNNFVAYRKNKNSVQPQVNYINHSDAKNKVCFGAASLKGGVTKFFDTIGANFFIEFLVVDSISMIIPRIVIGLLRDHDKTGKINYKAGAEEAGREVLSGPSMNLIPMAILLCMRHKFPASHLTPTLYDQVDYNMQKVVSAEKDTAKFADSKAMDEALANQIFEDAFGNYKLAGNEDMKSEFSKLLLKTKTCKPALIFQSKDYKAKLADFQKYVSKIQNMNEKGLADSNQSIKMTMIEPDTNKVVRKSVASDELFEGFHNYSKDIISKFASQNFANKTSDIIKKESIDFLKNKKKISGNAKMTTALIGFLSVGAFLLYLPKLYQQSKISPAMESAKRAQEKVGGENENK